MKQLSYALGLSVVLVSAVVFSGDVALAGAKPRIDKITPDEVLPGGVLEIKGMNFSDKISETKATVGGKPAIVLDTKVEQMHVMVPPDTSAGNVSVIVDVAGVKSNKEQVKVLRNTAENREKVAKRDEMVHEGSDATKQAGRPLVLDKPRAMSDRGMTGVRCAGRAIYPDGCVVVVSLALEGHILGYIDCEVTRGRFQGTFGPYTKRLFSGHYTVEARFEASSQTGKIRRAFKKTYKDPAERAKFASAHDREVLRVGSDQLVQREQEEIQAHFKRVVERLLRLLDEIEAKFSMGGRALFRDSKGSVDEAAWELWLDRRSLRGVKGKERKDYVESWRAERSMLTGNNRFDEDAWREWLDNSYRMDVLALAEDNKRYVERWQVMRFHKQLLSLDDLFGQLLKLSQMRSQYLYERVGLKLHDNDIRLKGSDVLQLGASKTTPRGIERDAKHILRAVGVNPDSKG